MQSPNHHFDLTALQSWSKAALGPERLWQQGGTSQTPACPGPAPAAPVYAYGNMTEEETKNAKSRNSSSSSQVR